MYFLHVCVHTKTETLIYKSTYTENADWWTHRHRYECMWKESCTNACTCTHTHTHSLSGMNLKRKGERMRDVYVLKFLLAITQIIFKSVKQKRGKKKSIPDRRGSRSCEINYILFSNIVQRSLHSFRKVWSCQGAKNQLEMVMWKALPSSRQRPVLRSEMTLSSSLAGEGGWEGFKCPDSNNGHKGYLMWHQSPHWLLSLTWSIHIKK